MHASVAPAFSCIPSSPGPWPDEQTAAIQLSVVIPAKNESANIAPLIAEIRQALDGKLVYEIIYVDDGSTDDTLQQLRSARDGGCTHLRILRHDRSCGQSAAVRSGVKAARGSWIATLDADGQNNPADIPSLWDTLQAAAQPDMTLVAGVRVHRRDNLSKRISSRVANSVRQGLLHDHATDTGCGLKLFPRDMFLAFPAFDHMHRFLPALTGNAGGKVVEVPVNHRPRLHGKTKYGIGNRLWVGLIDMAGVLWLRHRTPHPDVTEDDP